MPEVILKSLAVPHRVLLVRGRPLLKLRLELLDLLVLLLVQVLLALQLSFELSHLHFELFGLLDSLHELGLLF